MRFVLNQETVNDFAKLIIHRLVVRKLARDPSLIEQARAAHAKAAKRFPDHQFVRDWDQILDRPVSELRSLLGRRGPDMDRLRLSSPFVVSDGFDFTELTVRRRIWSASRRLVRRAAARSLRRSAEDDASVS